MHHGAMMMAAQDASDPPPLPGAPGSFTATAISTSAIDLSWTDVSDETSYEIDVATDAGFSNIVQSTTAAADATSKTITGLSGDTEYHFRIRGINASGGGAYSTATESTIGATPDTPTNVSAVLVTNSSVRMWWTDNASGEQDYEVELRDASGGGGTLLASDYDVAANTETFEFTGLTPATDRYWARVRAILSGGAASIWVEASVDVVSTISPPSADAVSNALAQDAGSSTSLTQTWSNNASDHDSIEAQIALDASFTDNVQTEKIATAATETFQWTGLEANTEYHARVRLLKADSPGAWSATDSAFTEPDTVPSAVSNLAATPDADQTVLQTWTDPAGEQVSSITVRVENISEVTLDTDTIPAGVEQKDWDYSGLFSVPTFQPGDTGQLSARATNPEGNGAVTRVTFPTALTAPANFAQSDQGTFWRLTWDNDPINSGHIGNEIHRDTGGGFELFDTVDDLVDQYDVVKSSGTKWKVRAVSSDTEHNSAFTSIFTDPS